MVALITSRRESGDKLREAKRESNGRTWALCGGQQSDRGVCKDDFPLFDVESRIWKISPRNLAAQSKFSEICTSRSSSLPARYVIHEGRKETHASAWARVILA